MTPVRTDVHPRLNDQIGQAGGQPEHNKSLLFVKKKQIKLTNAILIRKESFKRTSNWIFNFRHM